MPNEVPAAPAVSLHTVRTLSVADEPAAVDAVRTAVAERMPLRIAGGRTWLDAGHPVQSEAILDFSALRGIVEYVPGDLTLTARAGTTLSEIEGAVGAHGQWLPLEPFGAPEGTIGATLATASVGPLAATVGLPRDVVLGVSFVTGEGRLARGGGRVVKNVAGFDLVRLTVGAWGTLGAITEATVRLRARPDADQTLVVPLPEEYDSLTRLLTTVRSAAIAPVATELLSGGLASRLHVGDRACLLVRLAGSAASVRAQRGEVERWPAPAVADASSDVWERLRRAEPAGALVVRISRRPSELARLWIAAQTIAALGGGDAHAMLERGVVRCWMRDASPIWPIESNAPFDQADVKIFERLPATLWSRLHARWPEERLPRAVRDAFDPLRILNRGIFGEHLS